MAGWNGSCLARCGGGSRTRCRARRFCLARCLALGLSGRARSRNRPLDWRLALRFGRTLGLNRCRARSRRLDLTLGGRWPGRRRLARWLGQMNRCRFRRRRGRSGNRGGRGGAAGGWTALLHRLPQGIIEP